MTPQPNTNNKYLNNNFKSFLTNIDNSHLLDKNGNIDKYYKSFEKLKYNKNNGCCKNPNEYADVLFKQHKIHINIPDELQFVSLIEPKREKININVQINCINDIIQLTKMYPLDKTKEYNINMEALHKIVKPLTELDNMIGMKNIKENIVDQILYYLQNLHKITKDDKKIISNDYMHTVIYGPPGNGKTEVTQINGKIYRNM